MPDFSAAWALLESETLGSFLSHRRRAGALSRPPVAMLKHSETTAAALDTLARHQVLSAPVIIEADPLEDRMTEDAGGGLSYSVLGWLSVGDMTRDFLGEVRGRFRPGAGTFENAAQLTSAGLDFAKRKVVSVHSEMDHDMMFRDASLETSIGHVVKHGFLRHPRRRPPPPIIHRIGVFDAHGEIIDVFSMSNVVAFLHAHVNTLGPELANATVADLGLATVPVHCVMADAPVYAALEELERKGVSGVAVVNPVTGDLVANLSESEIRGISPLEFGLLALPIATWLCLKMRLAPAVLVPACDTLKQARVAVTATPQTTFGELLSEIVASRVHRVWVTARPGVGQPIGVITLSDILEAIVPGSK